MAKQKAFGPQIREWRQEKEIGFWEFSDQGGLSAPDLSKSEGGDFPPPEEEKIIKIAKELGKDADELLALAGRVASDLSEIIQETPREMATFLRAARGLGPNDIEQLTRQLERKKRPAK